MNAPHSEFFPLPVVFRFNSRWKKQTQAIARFRGCGRRGKSKKAMPRKVLKRSYKSKALCLRVEMIIV